MASFQRSFIELLLVKDIPEELVDIASDTMLSLIFAEQGLFRNVITQFISEHAQYHARLTNAFSNLLTHLQPQFDREGRLNFRTKMKWLLMEVRSFLRVR